MVERWVDLTFDEAVKMECREVFKCLQYQSACAKVPPLKCLLQLHLRLAREDRRARWQSGDAAACKAAYAGSIPALASILKF